MRILSGTVDQPIYFVAVDETDKVTRLPGLDTFTVYRQRNGGALAAMTTPTVTEVDSTLVPGLYSLTLDEDMTIGDGNVTEEMVFEVQHAGMEPVTRTIELYDGLSAAQTEKLQLWLNSITKVTFTSTGSSDKVMQSDYAEGTVDHARGSTLAMAIGSLQGQHLLVTGNDDSGQIEVINATEDVVGDDDVGLLM